MICATILSFLCFNSQRDGILQFLAKNISHLKEFQFPTGWNSTLGTYQNKVVVAWFQFPTGWNSTNAFPTGMGTTEFQFPTGWNSTD